MSIMAERLMYVFLLLALVQQAFSACKLEGNAPDNGYFLNKYGERRTGKAVSSSGIVMISCEDGFELSGADGRTCEKENDGKLRWGSLMSVCIDINECKVGILLDEETQSIVGDSFSSSFSSSASDDPEPKRIPACHTKARCTNLVGSYTCECKECFTGDGKHCTEYNEPCPDLNESLEHGKIEIKGNGNLEYTCDENYRSTSYIRTCDCNGNWFPDNKPAFCEFQGCSEPPNIQNGGIIADENILYGSSIYYTCNEGFYLAGPNRRTCLVSGEFSYYEPICKKNPTFVDIAKDFKDSFIDKVGSYSNTSAAGGAIEGRLAANAVGLDIVFAFDASSSISYTDFEYGVEFAKLLVDEFGVSYEEGGTRLAAVVFASGARVKFNFNQEDANEIQEVKDKITEIQQELGGGTSMREAFETIFQDVIPEMRPEAKRALFMMTDGESNDGNPSAAAKRLRDSEDVEIFAVGIGAQVDRNELKSIANTPYTSHVFLIKSYSDLQILSEVISERRVDFNRCGVAIDIDIKEAKEKEAVQENYDVEIPNSWPWVASITRKFKNSNVFRHICGGTLLCNQWVLTAASCVNRNSKPLRVNEIKVTFGQHNRSSDSEIEVQEIEVEEIILADGFVRDNFDRDLALIKLKTPVILASFVRTACLGTKDDVIRSAFEDCYTIGWGANDLGDKADYPEIPQQLRMPVLLDNDCEDAHEAEFNENILCAGYRSEGNSACLGDTGGALVCIRHDETWAVVGVALPGNECDQNGKYGLYTKPAGFTEWINSITENCLENHLNIFD
ncbi:uncharacterized protein [Antedon mediterranea]|uniref:uncharacterized protein n=1 Tax=Antedon mediterranea TaxID=105859 RepID=UPI003AF65310